jgi:N-glycosylase/DNA lyase
LKLPEHLQKKYTETRKDILRALKSYSDIPKDKYFYECSYCILTPQSKAKNAWAVQLELEKSNFYENPFDASELLRQPENYIRFHNQKAKRLFLLRDIFPVIEKLLESESPAIEKRNKLAELVNGYGMKEASHLMRNIGYRNLAILDRHILQHLVECGIFEEIPKVNSKKQYLEVENKFLEYAEGVRISIDELDLLFWSYNTGEILK